MNKELLVVFLVISVIALAYAVPGDPPPYPPPDDDEDERKRRDDGAFLSAPDADTPDAADGRRKRHS